MTTPYKPTNWGDNEPLYTDKMNQMTNNDQWLYENTPRVLYNANGVKRGAQIKILGGIAIFPPGAGTQTRDIVFPAFFTAGCRPIITTGLGRTYEYRVHIAFRGIGQDPPDHRGFSATISVDPLADGSKYNKLTRSVVVHYIALGY